MGKPNQRNSVLEARKEKKGFFFGNNKNNENGNKNGNGNDDEEEGEYIYFSSISRICKQENADDNDDKELGLGK